MIAFSCSHCGKALRVKEGLTGNSVRCPHCNDMVPVPRGAAPGPVHGLTTALPGVEAPGPLGPGLATAPGRMADAPTLPPRGPESIGGAGTDTLSAASALDRERNNGEREWTAFLAPPQGPGEIGRLGPYRVLKVLGAGGMGVVFKAEDPHLERPVALKVMLPALGASDSARQRFLREARTAAAVKNDHVVSIYQVSEDRGAPFLAMEFLEGESLDDCLRRAPRLSVGEVLRVGRETALGLAAAHARGLIHRDVKPANLWLDASAGGRVKVLDFGLARRTSGEQNLTQTGAIVGTPAYMAPEQASGLKVDGRADLFSLGVTLYRASTGELPFRGQDTLSTLMALATEDPPPPHDLNPELPRELSDLVMQLLAKNPDRRMGSAREVVEAIQRIEQAVAAGVSPSIPRKAPVKARRARVLALAAGLLLVVVGGAVYLATVFLRGPDKAGHAEVGPLVPAEPPAPKPAAPKPLPERKVEEGVKGAPPSPKPKRPDPKPGAATVNLLSLIDTQKDAVSDRWRLNDAGELVSGRGEDARLQLPYRPPAEYDLRIAFTRTEGNDAVAPILYGGGRQFQYFIAGFGNSVCGFDNVNGKDPDDNETTVKRGAWLQNGQRYEARFEVRRDGAKAYLDGKLISRLKTDYSNIYLDKRFSLKGPAVLGLGT